MHSEKVMTKLGLLIYFKIFCRVWRLRHTANFEGYRNVVPYEIYSGRYVGKMFRLSQINAVFSGRETRPPQPMFWNRAWRGTNYVPVINAKNWWTEFVNLTYFQLILPLLLYFYFENYIIKLLRGDFVKYPYRKSVFWGWRSICFVTMLLLGYGMSESFLIAFLISVLINSLFFFDGNKEKFRQIYWTVWWNRQVQ